MHNNDNAIAQEHENDTPPTTTNPPATIPSDRPTADVRIKAVDADKQKQPPPPPLPSVDHPNNNVSSTDDVEDDKQVGGGDGDDNSNNKKHSDSNNNDSNDNIKTTNAIPLTDGRGPVPPTDVDIMDVSPTAHPDATVTVDDNNKENADAQLDQNPLLSSVTNPNQPVHQLTEAVTPSLTPNQTNANNPNHQSAAPHPATSLDEDNRDTQFTFVLRKYTTIVEHRVYSPWHYFGGYKWRLLIFPRGNHTSNHDLSVYLECGGPHLHDDVSQQSSNAANNTSSNINDPTSPSGGKDTSIITAPSTPWNRHAKFSLHLVHPTSPIAKAAVNSDDLLTDPSMFDLDITDSNTPPRMHANPRSDMVKETNHTFRQNVSDWGFLEFAPFSTLQPNSYADDSFNVVIMVKIRLQEQTVDPFPNTAPWDSRRETGLVGFKNQGATCYMNSLLQTLYMLSAFRKAVYNMPLPEEGNENSGSELSYALQKVFYELQFSPSVVKTKKLTESFGWDTTDAFTQHDVQELKLILCDELAEKMKKIAPNQPNSLSTLFQGKLLNYIECTEVEYRSTREEEFSDLSLNVKGCRDIYQSFDKYIEVEMMEGDNRYRADGFEELQNARKGVKFLQLPPVLQLHLKRFEYDTTRDAMVKINDRYEFQTDIDLSRFVEDSNGDDIYVLHSVLVHIGDVNGGHYHAFIRPSIDTGNDEGKKQMNQWYKFDDETVTPAYEEAAVQENFGVGGDRDFGKRGIDDELGNGGLNGQTNPPNVFPNRGRNYQPRRFSNAYMLQYLRKSDVHYLLAPRKKEDVPPALGARIEKEREEEEQRKRDNTEKHLYLNTLVANDTDMVKHHETDLVNWTYVRPLCVKRATKLGELKMVLQKEGIIPDARRVRLWKCSARPNQIVRPDCLVADGDDAKPIDSIRDIHTGLNVPLYHPRHNNYYSQDDAVRLYAEDLSSKYCLSPGLAFSTYIQANGEKDRDAKEEMELSADEKTSIKEKMETEVAANDYSAWSFPLKANRETLLFVKYYSCKPQAKLQWLGHLVVDSSTKVKDLEPLLRKAVEDFSSQEEDSIVSLTPGSKLTIFEEEYPTEIKELAGHMTLTECHIQSEGGNGDIIVFQEDWTPASGGENNDENNLADEEARVMKGEDNKYEGADWDGYQEISRGDGTDLPLGGRPLPLLTMFYEYLANRIKIEFKDRHSAGETDDVRSIFFEMSRKDSYRKARKVLTGGLPNGRKMNPDYIRFFAHDFTKEAPATEAFRIPDDIPLERVVPMHTIVTSGQPEYRTIWYEVTEYHISEFEHKEELRVVWRPDCGTRSTGYVPKATTNTNNSNTNSTSNTKNNVEMKDVSEGVAGTDMSVDGDDDKKESSGGGGENGEAEVDDSMNGSRNTRSATGSNGETIEKCAHMFSVLVPIAAKFVDVMDEIRIKRNVPSNVDIRMFEVRKNSIVRGIEPNEPVRQLLVGGQDYTVELRAEPVPEDETAEALGDEYELMTVVHLAKQGRSLNKAVSLFGQPFVIKVKKDGETVDMLRRRIQDKLDVPSEEFDTWKLVEISQSSTTPLESGEIYTPRRMMGLEFSALAIEHKSTALPKRTSSTVNRYTDKPLKIRS